LQEVDPALHAAVEALIQHDPAVSNDPELAAIVRDVAEATVHDPVERAVVTREVVELQREGIDVRSVIPPEVREAARDGFQEVRGQMEARIEVLRATDPEAAREMELRMNEGDRVMRAFEAGERYMPSPEIVQHAREMFRDWETQAIASGASDRDLMMARAGLESFYRGEMMGPGGPGTGGPMGFELGGGPGPFGPGPEGGAPMMGPPSQEQLQAAVDAGQISQAEFTRAMEGLQQWEAAANDPAAREALMREFGGHGPMGGGFEGMMPPEGFEGVMPPGGFEGFAGPAGFEGFMPEGFEGFRPESFEGFRPEGGFNPEFAREGFEHFGPEIFAPEVFGPEFAPPEIFTPEFENIAQIEQNFVPPTQDETFFESRVHVGHMIDTNNDGIGDVQHVHPIMRHSDGTCHDHDTGATVGC
jgi:hypothetical protein